MKLKFLTKLLVCVVMMCVVMFFAGCSDDDKDNKVDYGKTGKIVGVYETEYTYHSSVDGDIPAKITFTLKSNGTGNYIAVVSNGRTINKDFTWNSDNNMDITILYDSGYTESAIFDGADTIHYYDYELTRKK